MFETLSSFLNDLFITPIEANRYGKPPIRPPEPVHQPKVARQCHNPLAHFIEAGLKAITFIDRKCLRKELAGVLVRKGFMIATDGHRLYKEKVDVPVDEVIIPVDFFKTFRNNPLIRLGLSRDRKALIANGVPFREALIPGPYPDIDHVLPKRHEHEMVVDRDRLITAVHSIVKVPGNDAGPNLVFDPRRRGMLTVSLMREPGKVPVQLVPYQGDCLAIRWGWNGEFLLGVLRCLQGPRIRVRMNGAVAAMVFLGESREAMAILMPLRIHDESAVPERAAA